MDLVKSKIETLEALLRQLTDAAYSLLCESNGLSDNEWKTKEGGVLVPEWPTAGYYETIMGLDAAYTAASDYFEPAEAEKRRKWADACATASYIVDRFREDWEAAEEAPNLIESHLHRNIADAINGGLVQTVEDRKAGKMPTTMGDKLNELVARGDLVEIGPSGKSVENDNEPRKH